MFGTDSGLLQFHAAWAWVVILGNGMAGVWALCAARWPGLRTRALWWFVAFVEGAVFVQVGVGVALVNALHDTPPAFHPFYGFVAIVCVGFLYGYRGQLWRHRYLLYGFGSLLVMGVAIRAMLTAHGG